MPDSPIDAYRAWLTADTSVVSGRGLDAVVIGATLAAPKKTWLLPGKRERGCAILRGAQPDALATARPYRVIPPGDSPAIRALVAVGLAMAGEPALVFLGSGSASYGAFHEALHLAAAHAAPVIFVVSWYVGEGPFAPQLVGGPAALASSLGIAGIQVDGNDEAAVRAAVAGAVGPTVIEARLTGRA